jgi:hypothetical protein
MFAITARRGEPISARFAEIGRTGIPACPCLIKVTFFY